MSCSEYRRTIGGERACEITTVSYHSQKDDGSRNYFTPIWRVCRQLYLEASVFLYSDNVFDFPGPNTATTFFTAITLTQLASLGCLRFPGLKEFAKIRISHLKKLTGLKRIELERRPREPEYIYRRLASALPGKCIRVIFLSELTISDIRNARKKARYI